MLEPLTQTPMLATLALMGALGGAARFLFAWRSGAIRNNKFLRKALLDIAGGGIVGCGVSPLFIRLGDGARLFLAFGVGLAWSEIVHAIRERVTAIVEAAIGQSSERDQKRHHLAEAKNDS